MTSCFCLSTTLFLVQSYMRSSIFNFILLCFVLEYAFSRVTFQDALTGEFLTFLIILFIILLGFHSSMKLEFLIKCWSIDKLLFPTRWFFWLLNLTLVPALNEHMLTDSDIWGIHLSKITNGFYAWSFQYGLWAISHHSNALFPPKVVALISSNLAMAFLSLIRNLILGSISEQLVENYSKWFKTHFINGPIYPYTWEILRILNECGEILFGIDVVFPDFGVGGFLSS